MSLKHLYRVFNPSIKSSEHKLHDVLCRSGDAPIARRRCIARGTPLVSYSTVFHQHHNAFQSMRQILALSMITPFFEHFERHTPMFRYHAKICTPYWLVWSIQKHVFSFLSPLSALKWILRCDVQQRTHRQRCIGQARLEMKVSDLDRGEQDRVCHCDAPLYETSELQPGCNEQLKLLFPCVVIYGSIYLVIRQTWPIKA